MWNHRLSIIDWKLKNMPFFSHASDVLGRQHVWTKATTPGALTPYLGFSVRLWGSVFLFTEDLGFQENTANSTNSQ